MLLETPQFNEAPMARNAPEFESVPALDVLGDSEGSMEP